MIPGTINLPAHSLPLALDRLVPILPSVPLIAFQCDASRGRGPRAADWYADALQDYLAVSGPADAQGGSDHQRVGVLIGGIKAWEEAYGASPVEERGKTPNLRSIDHDGSLDLRNVLLDRSTTTEAWTFAMRPSRRLSQYDAYEQ